MAKKPTEKQLAARAKFAEAARERAAARRAEKKEPFNHTSHPDGSVDLQYKTEQAIPEQPKVTIGEADYLSLQRQVLELKEMLLSGKQLPNQVGVQNGRLTGYLEKYSLAPTDYPNPVQRLLKEPKLSRFALPVNYDLMWKVTTVEYTTIDNVRVKEPRFTLELGRKIFDEDTGEPQFDENGNQKGYIISRLIMHEDPDASLAIAREQEITVDETNEKAFLDEMRYLRMRDWLLECFFPTPIKKEVKKDMVVGGKVVETYSITSTNSEKIPFDKISGSMLR